MKNTKFAIFFEHTSYVRYLFEFSEIDVLAITDTRFPNDVPDIYFDLQGYIFKNDRTGRAGVYVKSNLSAKII